MNINEVLTLHNQLWESHPTGYRMAYRQGLQFITQNLSKNSSNTRWIKKDPDNRRLTWILRNGKYVGRVHEHKNNGTHVIEVRKLNPEKLIYRSVD